MTRDSDDLQLVRESLGRVAHLPSNYAAAEVLGVSEGTVRRWRAGEIALPLRDKTRRALRNTGEAEVVVGEAEEWLAKIANPDMLRRQAGTPTGRDLIKGIKSFLFDLPWPVEQKNAVDALLNRIAADAEKPEH